MRWLFFLMVLCLPFTLPAQRRVSDVCVPIKQQSDSLMRAYYGDYLFEKYFRFDSSSAIEIRNRTYYLSDTLPVDSAFTYYIRYKFEFPATKFSYSNFYVVTNDPYPDEAWGKVPQTLRGRCALADSVKMDAVCKRGLNRSLKKCEVSLVEGFPAQIVNHPHYDSSHVYLQISYTKVRNPFYNRSLGKITTHYLIVDACTGEVFKHGTRRSRVYTHF